MKECFGLIRKWKMEKFLVINLDTRKMFYQFL
jgi:hypothetical protein